MMVPRHLILVTLLWAEDATEVTTEICQNPDICQNN